VSARGRSCPLAYRYQPEALARPSQLAADTLYVVGGLYGNLAAGPGRARQLRGLYRRGTVLGEYEAGLAAAGFEQVSVAFTH
jgi:hypothetical protein